MSNTPVSPVEKEKANNEHTPPLRWIPLMEIAKGDVSRVYRVTDPDGKVEGAMKIEKLAKDAHRRNIEKDVLIALKNDPNAVQLIDYFYCGKYQCTVMTVTGQDLQTVKDLLHNKFSDSTIIRIAIRLLLAIKSLHECGYIHRDIEPPNITLSTDPKTRNLFLVDFGCARQYARHDGNKWVLRAARSKVPFRGSYQYCSPKMHDGEEIARVDDLWSWLFVLFELRATLPWTDATHVDRYGPRKRRLLEEIMENHPFLQLFAPIVKLLRTYKYEDRPDYNQIYEILNAKMLEMGVKWADPMDYDVDPVKPSGNDEKVLMDQLAKSFREVTIPGGAEYLMPSHLDFVGEPKNKAARAARVAKLAKEKEKEKATTKKSDAPSRTTETISKQPKVTKQQKKATVSTTSSASRQTPPQSVAGKAKVGAKDKKTSTMAKVKT